jgi:hypothetical protein
LCFFKYASLFSRSFVDVFVVLVVVAAAAAGDDGDDDAFPLFLYYELVKEGRYIICINIYCTYIHLT